MLAGQDLMVVLAIAFFIFGSKKLPEIGSGLGKAMRDFKDGLNGIDREILEAPTDKPKGSISERTKGRDKRLEPATVRINYPITAFLESIQKEVKLDVAWGNNYVGCGCGFHLVDGETDKER